MEKTDQDRLSELCSVISREENPDKFAELLDEMNRLLEKEEQRLLNKHQAS